MRYPRILLLLLAAVAWSTAAAAGPPPAKVAADPTKLAELINARLEAEWKTAGVEPAPLVDDTAFLRRVSLDLIGRVPTVAEARSFFADSAPDKQTRLIERLVDSGGHTRHMATFWRRTWLPQADSAEFARLANNFEAWVAARLQENAPYDRMVRELLTSSESTGRRAAVSPDGFFAASENKPENLAANATRSFLGVNLDCAQCHNHPFARWTRDQFWQTAAFFAGPPKGDAMKSEMMKGGAKTEMSMAMLPMLMIPNTTKTLGPELLDGTVVKWPNPIEADSGRKLLATWVVAKENPYFSRNAVNRLWAHIYGTALVEPLDDLSSDSAGEGYQAKLLGELAEAFAASGFDIKYITRALVLAKAYQLSAVSSVASDPRLFAKMPVRGLTGEQLYDSIRTAAGLPPERAETDRGQGLAARRTFASQFYVARPVSAERSITQALSMMNGRLVNDLTDPAKNPTLSGVIHAPFLDTAGRIEAIFLAVVGRKPSAKEAKALLEYVESFAGTDRERAFGDLFWVIVNSSEFNTNH